MYLSLQRQPLGGTGKECVHYQCKSGAKTLEQKELKTCSFLRPRLSISPHLHMITRTFKSSVNYKKFSWDMLTADTDLQGSHSSTRWGQSRFTENSGLALRRCAVRNREVTGPGLGPWCSTSGFFFLPEGCTPAPSPPPPTPPFSLSWACLSASYKTKRPRKHWVSRNN